MSRNARHYCYSRSAPYHIGGIHKVLVDSDATHIVEICLCHLYTMQLRFQYFYHHNGKIYFLNVFVVADYSLNVIWSIRRIGVLPQYTVMQPAIYWLSSHDSTSCNVLPSTIEKYSTSSPSTALISATTLS